jgi:hypothetical protein
MHCLPFNTPSSTLSDSDDSAGSFAGSPVIPSGSALIQPNAIAGGFTPNAAYDLVYQGGKTVANAVIQLVFVDSSTSTWTQSDGANIDIAVASALADHNLNSVIAQYYSQPITTTYLRSFSYFGTSNVYKYSDVTALVQALYQDNTLTGDFANTCFCFLLAPGIQLFGPNGEDSHSGLAGYHAPLDCTRTSGADRVYFAVCVYSEVSSTTVTNGIVVFSDSWRNVCATIYHEFNEFRTDPDINNGKLGWYSNNANGEIGDIGLSEAGNNLSLVILNVPLADGSGATTPIQLMYSNADHGPSAGDDVPLFLYHDWQVSPNGGWTGGIPLGGFALEVTVATNADGRLEVFYIGTDHALYHNWQVSPGGGWAGQQPLVGSALQLAVGRNADGRLEIFYVGTNLEIYHNYQTSPGGGWFGQAQFGGFAQQIAVGQNADGRLEIFYVGGNGNLYHNYQNTPSGDWAGEAVFAGDSAKQVTVASNADGRLEIFYVGTNNGIYHNWQTAANQGWAGESQFPGVLAQQIAVARNHDGRLEFFYIGTNNDLFHNWQITAGGGWNGETRFAQNSAHQVAVGTNADGRLEIFYVGTDASIYHNWQAAPGAGWIGETRLDSQARQIAVCANADGRLEMFYIGN